MLDRLQKSHPIDDLEPVTTENELAHCQRMVRDVFVDDKVRRYMLDLVTTTREHDDIRLGCSPRASIALFRASQALAAIRGRNFVMPDDVKRLAVPTMAHRIILKPEARLRKLSSVKVVENILSETAVPVPVPVPTVEARTA